MRPIIPESRLVEPVVSVMLPACGSRPPATGIARMRAASWPPWRTAGWSRSRGPGSPGHPRFPLLPHEPVSRAPVRPRAPDHAADPPRAWTSSRSRWDEALELIAETMLRIREESGPAAILNYRCGGSLGLMKHVTDYFFERFGPVTIKSGDICSGAGEAAQDRGLRRGGQPRPVRPAATAGRSCCGARTRTSATSTCCRCCARRASGARG